METLFKPAYFVEPVNPLDVAPDPGEMGQMYIDLRQYEGFEDGMVLALANHRRNYEEIKRDYVAQCTQPGFSVLDFFHANFELDSFGEEAAEPDPNAYLAVEGEDIDTYIERMRKHFIIPKERNGGFDVELPEDRAVAGVGRFGRQSFLWDGCHMAKGYAAAGRWDLVMNMAYNLEYQINKFGYPLNGSAYFFATRSQPDYFPDLIRMLAAKYGPEALVRFLPALEKDFMGYWMDGYKELSKKPLDGKVYEHRTLVRLADGSFLNRYWDDADTPRLESYKEDVDTVNRATENLFPKKSEADVNMDGLKEAFKEKSEAEVALDGLKKAFKAKMHRNLRAGATSGWDYSSRWFADGSTIETINTTDIAPVDLNSLMAYYAETLAMAYRAKANQPGIANKIRSLRKAAFYQDLYDQRVVAINKHLWDAEDKIYRDYNFVKGEQTKIVSAAMVYPLYVGIANAEQSFGVMCAVERDLLYAGGVIATTTEDSEEQWDGGRREGGKRSKNVWAPLNWAAMRGFARMAHKLQVYSGASPDKVEPLLQMAERVQKAYTYGIETVFRATRSIPEKHRGDRPDQIGDGGEYKPVKLLAMSPETYVAMKARDVRHAQEYAAIGSLATRQALEYLLGKMPKPHISLN